MAGRFSVEAVFKAVDRVTAPITRMQNRVGKFTRSMEAGLRRANKALNKVVGGLARGAKTAVKFGVVGLGAISAGVALLLKQFSKIENAQAAFQPLIGSAEKARQAVEAINETAATTPFQFETLADSVNQLLPVMNGNIEDVIKTVRMLGDTAGGNAQKLETITRGFTKAMLKGKVDMESLNMIAEAGVPIFGDLAEVMGVQVNAAFFKMISAGRVTTQQLTKAFEKMTNKGGKFFQGMEIASRTTSGMLSTLTDNISLTAAELGSVLAPTVKELIGQSTEMAKRVREWVKGNKELIGSKFLAFVTRVKQGVNSLVEAIRTMNDENSVFDRLSSIIVDVSDAFSFLRQHGATIAKIIAAVIALSAAVKVAAIAMAAFNLVMAANPFVLLAVAVAGVIVFVDDLISAFDKLPAVIRIAMLPIKLALEAISKLKEGIGFVGGKVAAFFEADSPDEAGTAQAAPAPRVVSPQDRVARSIEEQRTTSTSEVTIKDESGRAEVTGGKLGQGLKLQQTGAF
jgi:tape measure domain-containing protein